MAFWKVYSKPYLSLKDFLPYQRLVERVLEFSDIQDDKRYLDAGCGPGHLIHNRRNITGIDFSEAMLEEARKANPDSSFFQADLNNRLHFPNETFDGIYSNNVLAYLEDSAAVLREFKRVLKPGGKLVLSTLRRSFNPLQLIGNHFRSGKRVSGLRNWLKIAWIIFLNLQIVLKLRLNQYHGFEIDDLKLAAEAAGFQFLHGELAYDNQNVLLVARRREADLPAPPIPVPNPSVS